MDSATPPPPDLAPGLGDLRALSLERFLVRERESSVTRSGWRLLVTGPEGDGAIVLLETAAAEAVFRGEGVFLGWPRERLEAAYRALQPRSDAPDFSFNQLG